MNHEPDRPNLRIRILGKAEVWTETFYVRFISKIVDRKTFTLMLIQEKQEAMKNLGYLLSN